MKRQHVILQIEAYEYRWQNEKENKKRQTEKKHKDILKIQPLTAVQGSDAEKQNIWLQRQHIRETDL